MMDEARLAELEALAEKATPGSWTAEYLQSRFGHQGCVDPVYPDDAAFIAAAREAVPELIAALREMTALARQFAAFLSETNDVLIDEFRDPEWGAYGDGMTYRLTCLLDRVRTTGLLEAKP